MAVFPPAVLAATVLAAEKVSFVLVGSAALWLRSEIATVGDADAVIECGERNIHRLRGALTDIAIGAYTGARITSAGRVVLAAERGEIAPVPIGLINGKTYREGLRPPFRPRAIIDAAREVINRSEVPDKGLTSIIGLPYFVTGCTVTGNLAALAAGRRTKLRLQAQVSISEDRSSVVVQNIPPNISTDHVAQIIASRARPRRWADEHPGLHHLTHLPLAGLRHDTSERSNPFGRLICIPERGMSAEELRDRLLEVPGVSTTMPAALPQPQPALIKHWVQANAHEDLVASLAVLEHAIRSQR